MVVLPIISTIVWQEPIIQLRAGRFMHTDGIIIGAPTLHDMHLEDAKEFIALFKKLEPDGNWCLLVDQRGVSRKLDAAARQHMASEIRKHLHSLAILTGNTVSRFFASGIIAALGMRTQARAFDSDAEALRWIREAHATKA